MWFLKKTSLRRSKLRKTISADRSLQIKWLSDTDLLISALLWLLFVVLCVFILSLGLIQQGRYSALIPLSVIVLLISTAAAFYIHHFQKRIIKNHARALAVMGMFVLLLTAARFGALINQSFWATGTAVTVAIILTIAYDQRFALGMSIFYCLLACFAAEPNTGINLFLIMGAAVFTCCFSLKEVRTRMKLLRVSTLAAFVVFITALALDLWAAKSRPLNSLAEKTWLAYLFDNAGRHAGITLVVGVLTQGLLPLIEKIFRIATSMTLLDYSDANQPLLKRLAMEAPGTFSHSLLIGSIAEAAAEAIGCNGLLCRVGAYYHDIGKINKPGYFVENEMGSISRHKELSPAMSQLIIVGHVKDGIEMAKEYRLPNVLRQFIEAHHGTTLVEPFYNEAKKLKTQNAKGKAVETLSESEFRYPGPRPRTKEAAIVMLADAVEGAVRSLSEVTPAKVDAVVRNMAMKRLQDGQFDECEISLRELSQVEASMSKTLAAHYHGRIAYPTPPDVPEDAQPQNEQIKQKGG